MRTIYAVFFMFVTFSSFSMATIGKTGFTKDDVKTECGIVKGMRDAGDFGDAIILDNAEVLTSSRQWDSFLAASMAGQFRVCIDTVLFQGRKVIVKVVRE